MDLSTKDDVGLDGAEWFCPDFKNNLDLPEGQQAGLLCKHMSATELQRAELKSGGAAKRRAKSARQMLRAFTKENQERRDRVLKECVVGVRNWFLVDGETKSEIKTWDELRVILMSKRGMAGEVMRLLNDTYEFILGESTLDEDLSGESN